MSWLRNIWGCLFVVAALLILFSRLPLATAFEFSKDEGYEVMKPFLMNQGHVLYTEIWNNMPPVFSYTLAYSFKFFGTSILTARLVAAGFGLLLFVVFHDLVRQRSGNWTALCAAFFLLASPSVLPLSVAAMLEMPTMATGLLAIGLLFQWRKHPHWAWLLSSGAFMGLAIQTKPTAVLLIPAAALEFALLTGKGTIRSLGFRRTALNLVVWGTGILTIGLLVGLTWGQGSFAQSWTSHTVAQVVPGMDRVEDHPFKSSILWNHVECLLAAATGVVLALGKKRGREIAFPVMLLLTDALVHAVHQPWWDYYYLHLAIPLAWLAGWAAHEVIQDILRLHAKYGFQLSRPAAWKQWILSLLVAAALTRSELRLEWIVKDLRHRPSIDANPIVQKMKEFAPQAQSAYSDLGLYPFHARLPVPPELAIVTLKRFWSGQLTTGQIREICQREKIPLIILSKGPPPPEWQTFLNTGYILTTNDDANALYTAKEIDPHHD